MMRFLFISFIASDRSTGMGKWSYRVAEELRASGHDVILRFADDYPRMRSLGRAAVLLFPVLLALELFRRRRSFDAAVVHEPLGFWYGQARRFFRRLPPMLLICHNVESRHFADMVRATSQGFAGVTASSRLKNLLLRRWQSDGAIRRADAVLCLSSLDAEVVRRMNSQVVRTINGTDPAAPSSADREARRVLFVGGWLDVKGRRVLPPLWAKVIERVPDARLSLVGTGAPESIVLAEFDPKTRGSVQVLPRVNSAVEMNELYLRSAIFLMPSLSEGSPLALLEAMSAGAAPVAARVGGIPDIVTDGQDGLLFESMDTADGAEKVLDLLSDAALAGRIGAAAAARARSLGWDRTARAVLDAALLAGARAPNASTGPPGVNVPRS